MDCLRDVMIDKVYYSILPFRIWNHFFLCERSQYVKNICLDCTKLYIKSKRISNYINDNLYVNMIDFPDQITRRIVCANKTYIFAHTNAYSKKYDPFGRNLGLLYNESLNTPFLLWKFHVYVLCSVIFHLTDRHILSILNEENCQGVKKINLRQFFIESLFFSVEDYVSCRVLALIHLFYLCF